MLLGGGVGLAAADVGRAMDDLALQIGQRHHVVVDHAELADACGGEIHQRRRAEPARADHQHGRFLQRLLAGPADFAQHDVAGVAFEFVGAEHPASFSISPLMVRSAHARLER